MREGIPETFEREAIQAVLSEWFKTIASLPAGLRMAVEMGVVSSAQLVRIMSVDVRPTAGELYLDLPAVGLWSVRWSIDGGTSVFVQARIRTSGDNCGWVNVRSCSQRR